MVPPKTLFFFLAATISLSMTLGNHPVAIAAYLFNFFATMGFAHASESNASIGMTYVAAGTMFYGAVLGVMGKAIPLHGLTLHGLCLYTGFEVATSFALSEKILANMNAGPLAKSLVFPVVSTSYEFYHTLTYPYGSYGIGAYTQYGVMALMQICSLFGIWTMSFFISWVGGTVARIAILLNESGPILRWNTSKTTAARARGKIAKGQHSLLSCIMLMKYVVGVVVLALVYGGGRIKFLAWDGASNAGEVPTIRTAGIWPKNTLRIRNQLLRHHLGLEMDGKPGPGNEFGADWEEIVELSLEDYDEAEKSVAVEAAAGAKIVMMPELALVTFDDPAFPKSLSTPVILERMAKLAKENDVFVGIGIGFNKPFDRVPYLPGYLKAALNIDEMVGMESNRFLLFSPRPISKEEFDEIINGEQGHEHINLNYRKMNPVPVIETPFVYPGNATIPVHDINFFGDGSEPVKTSAAICFDMENPTHIRGTSPSNVVLNPSFDWPGLNPYHARIVAFRAIENGANIFHHCLAGTSFAVDYIGNVLAQTDYFSVSGFHPERRCVPMKEKPCINENIVAMMPTVGVRTLYGAVGDVLAWSCVFLTVAMTLKYWLFAGRSGQGGNVGGRKCKAS